MHASRVVAASETYIGLVELARVLSRGGGTKEIMRRIIIPIKLTWPSHFRSSSAPSCKSVRRRLPRPRMKRVTWDLNPQDRIVLNRDHLPLSQARNLAYVRGGYKPPAPEMIYASGRDMYGAMKIAVVIKKGSTSQNTMLISQPNLPL